MWIGNVLKAWERPIIESGKDSNAFWTVSYCSDCNSNTILLFLENLNSERGLSFSSYIQFCISNKKSKFGFVLILSLPKILCDNPLQ